MGEYLASRLSRRTVVYSRLDHYYCAVFNGLDSIAYLSDCRSTFISKGLFVLSWLCVGTYCFDSCFEPVYQAQRVCISLLPFQGFDANANLIRAKKKIGTRDEEETRGNTPVQNEEASDDTDSGKDAGSKVYATAVGPSKS